MTIQDVKHLGLYESNTVIKKVGFTGEVTQPLQIGSNSLLVTLELTGVQSDGTIQVDVYQYTSDFSKLQLVKSLGPLSTLDDFVRGTIIQLHNNVVLKASNPNAGLVDFNVYATPVSGFATTLSSQDGTEIRINSDGSMQVIEQTSTELRTLQQVVTSTVATISFPSGFTSRNFILKSLGRQNSVDSDENLYISHDPSFTPGKPGNTTGGYELSAYESIVFENYDPSVNSIYVGIESGKANQILSIIAID